MISCLSGRNMLAKLCWLKNKNFVQTNNSSGYEHLKLENKLNSNVHFLERNHLLCICDGQMQH